MPADKRPYITVADTMPEHPKVEALSDKAFRLLVDLWCYCHRNQNDGLLPAAAWAKRSTPKARAELLAAPFAVLLSDGSVQMRDYLDHQQSADDVAAARAKKQAAGSKGGHAKAASRKGGKPLAGATAGARADAVASALANGQHKPQQTASTDVAAVAVAVEVLPSEAPFTSGGGGKPPRTLTAVPDEHAGSVVAAYVDGATSAGKPRPSEKLRGKVGRDGKRLLGEGVPLAEVVAAARSCGARGWDDLDRERQQPQRRAVGDGRASADPSEYLEPGPFGTPQVVR